MTFRTAIFITLGLSFPTWANDDAGDTTPDASVGMGGAQMDQESDDDTNKVCSRAGDCGRGFSCVKGHCQYAGFRYAQGCSTMSYVPLAALGLLGVLRLETSRRSKRHMSKNVDAIDHR